jgi:hypothetical protein
VRSEVSAALARDIRVIPVLVDGASMPAATELPDPMASLARREALQLTSRHTRQDLQRLSDVVAEELWTKRHGSWVRARWEQARDRWGLTKLAVAGGLAAVALVAIVLAVTRLGGDSSELRQFSSSVDTILTASRRSRGQVSTVFSKLSTGARANENDLARIADIVDNRRDLGSASRGLLGPTEAARTIKHRLVVAFDASLKQDLAIEDCVRLGSRAQRKACLGRTQALSISAADAKSAFVASYNRVRRDLGLEPVDAKF